MKVTVEIAEVHKVIVEVEVPDTATREEICIAARREFLDENGEIALEYSHTLDPVFWTVRTESGFYI